MAQNYTRFFSNPGQMIGLLYLFCCVAATAEEYKQLPLLAGQFTASGNVAISNDATYIYVVYQTHSGWLIQETHLDVAADYSGLNTTKSGNPKPGKFPYHSSHIQPVSQVIYTIPNPEWPPGTEIVLANHAVVVSYTQRETAWAGEMDFPGANWATYTTYIIQSIATIEFSKTRYLHSERNSIAMLTVNRSGDLSASLTTDFTTVNGTATAGADYVFNSGTLYFDVNVASQNINITILNDLVVEGSETFNVVLNNSCCLGSNISATVEIVDDDRPR